MFSIVLSFCSFADITLRWYAMPFDAMIELKPSSMALTQQLLERKLGLLPLHFPVHFGKEGALTEHARVGNQETNWETFC